MRKTLRYPLKLSYVLAGLLIICCSGNRHEDPKLESLLPQIEGWKLSEKPRLFNYDNLYDYINGNCELYFSYGFQGLISAIYSNTEDPGKSVSIDIYDMGTPLNSFGVYSSTTHPDLTYKAIGCEGMVSSLQVKFWRDRYEVEINSRTTEGDTQMMIQEIAEFTSKNLPGCRTLPQLTWLPENGQVAHTLKYIADGFLGQGFFPGGLEALYRVDGEEVRGFLSNCGNEDQAKQLWNQYRESLHSFSGIEITDKGDHFEAFHRYSGYTWAGYQGPWFYGALSEDNANHSREIAGKIMENL